MKILYTVYKGTYKELTGNLKEIAKHFGISYYTFIKRIKSGMTPEEAIEKHINKNIKIITVYEGTDKEFTGSQREIVNHFGINYGTFTRKIRSGMSPEEAIENTVIINKIVYKGTDNEFIGSLRGIAKHFGINYGAFKRIIKSGMTVEEAIEKPIKNIEIITVYEGTDKEFTGNTKEITDHFGINYISFIRRIKSGIMTPEEAIEVPITRFCQNNLIYKGKTVTLKELCKLFNKNYTDVYNFLKYNHTLEYAMENTKKIFKEE